MLNHDNIWSAIDRLAKENKLSVSGLARAAGLDPTTFNKSKRFTGDGRPRWPSTESIAKILHATGTELDDFMTMVSRPRRRRQFATPRTTVPLIGFAQAGPSGFYEDGGFPVGTGLEEISVPLVADENAYALKVTGESMMPFYRDGDIIIVSPNQQIHRGDRVVAKTLDGEVMAKVLEKKTPEQVVLLSLNPDHPPRFFAPEELAWIARILWVSQ